MKFLWTELIAFDNTLPDFGVGEFLSRSRVKPDAISLLLLESSLFERHAPGLAADFPLPEQACSYRARPYSRERKRQAWTAFQLKGLVAAIRGCGVEVYASFFEWGVRDLTAPMADGEPYVDFFIRQTRAFLKDYGFTGLHAADGYAHPRRDLAQRGLPVDKRFEEAAKWAAFWKKASAAFKAAGFKTYLNTAWKRDPYEAVVRFGYDYRPIAESDIDGWVIEATSAVDELEGWNKTPESALDKNLAMLLRIGPALRGKPAMLLFGVKDDLEQYNCFDHAPAQTEAEALSTGVALCDGKRILSGMMTCLSDGILPGEWDRIDALWRTALLGEPERPLGVNVVWSEAAFERELRELPEKGLASSCTLLAGLIHCGAVIGGSMTLEAALADETAPLLVLHPGLFPERELAALSKRKYPPVLFGYGHDDFPDDPIAAKPNNWLDPLQERRPSREAFAAVRRAVNAFSPVVPSEQMKDPVLISGFRGTDSSWHVVARSNRPTYAVAELSAKHPVESVEILSRYPTMPVDKSLRAKIPPAGAVKLRLVDSRDEP